MSARNSPFIPMCKSIIHPLEDNKLSISKTIFFPLPDTETMVKSSPDLFSTKSTTISVAVFSCPGRPVHRTPNSVSAPSTIWTKMLPFALRWTIPVRLVWAISKSYAMASHWLCLHWSMARISMLVVTESVLLLNLKLKFVTVVLHQLPTPHHTYTWNVSWVECNFKNKLRNSELSKIKIWDAIYKTSFNESLSFIFYFPLPLLLLFCSIFSEGSKYELFNVHVTSFFFAKQTFCVTRSRELIINYCMLVCYTLRGMRLRLCF